MEAIKESQSRGSWETTVALLKEMQTMGLEITPEAGRCLFKDLKPAGACAMLSRLRMAGVTPEVAVYNCAVTVCVQAGDMQRAHKLGREMQGATSGPDVVTFSALLKGCQSTGDLSGAKEILKEMPLAGITPNEISYNTFINAAVTAADFQSAWEIVEMRKQAGVPVDKFLVSIMMKTVRQKNSRRPLHCRHATDVFKFLDESGVDFCSDEVLLSTVMDACVWHKEFVRAECILESYFQSRLAPSIFAYASLIKAGKCVKRMDMVWMLWREVVEDRELEPSVILMGCMLDALVCNNCVNQAFELFQEWKARVPPTTIIYSTLAKGLLNTHQAGRAMAMITEMRAEGVPRSTVLYNMVIGALATQDELDKVDELMQSMAEDGCTPDIITYSTVVKRFCVKGDFDAARGVLRQAQGNGIILDAIVYSSLFYGCYKHNRPDLTDEFVEHMRSFSLAPSSFTLSIIVRMYGGQGRLDRAFEVVEALSPQAARSDARVMANLLRECTRAGDLGRAEPLLQAMLAMGGPDAKTFWPLLILYVRRGEIQWAQASVDRWLTQGGSKGAGKDARVQQLVRALRGGNERESLDLLTVLHREASAFTKEDD